MYFGIFTLGNLWSFMNVVYPKDNISLLHTASVVFFIIGGIFFAMSYIHRAHIKIFFQTLGIFLLGFILAILPWGIKNYTSFEAGDKIGINGILNGKNQVFTPDYTTIHSKEFLENFKVKQALQSSGVSINEDLGRYLGYEK
jgi:4-amino-4-deoxy-L-arabinose transferase-like glycosyltransferase